ncbi:glycoside hydrolase family 6 protein [Mycolicibacterium sp. Y3]
MLKAMSRSSCSIYQPNLNNVNHVSAASAGGGRVHGLTGIHYGDVMADSKWSASRTWVTLSIAILAATASGWATATATDNQPAPCTSSPTTIAAATQNGNPLLDKAFYVDPTSSAAVAAARATPQNAGLNLIAGTPTAWWVDQQTPVTAAAAAAHDYVCAAAVGHDMPIVATYAIPHRDCGGFAAGGLNTADEYRLWTAELARGFGSFPVTIIIEPDGLVSADCLSAPLQHERLDLLRFAVGTFTQNPNAVVYIDGGHSRWLPAEKLAERLSSVGLSKARGFSLNVSNFLTTEEEAAYGEKVSSLTGGSSYVIDTSRNGTGPAPAAPLNWCNPQGRALGVTPSANTDYPHADAYLWIKRPGESDGDCGRGEPTSGEFFESYAVDLVHNRGR